MVTGIRDVGTMPDAFSSGVAGRRDAPLFDKYPISGRTYTTAHGAIVPNELLYYDGQMAHIYGECTNVAAVNHALAGSGYTAVTLQYPDGRRTAAAQLWVSRFTDSSIGAYSALFIVICTVRDDGQDGSGSIAADANGASSALAMFDGSFDAARGAYENRAQLFLVRLLDTTQVAIDVGRERMGTDKRPGYVDMMRRDGRLNLLITDEHRRGVVTGDLQLADDPAGYLPQLARAAATAGMPLRPKPRGTEYIYPCAARIGDGPVVRWQWRSDVTPTFQAVAPGTMAFQPGSEEGRLLLMWGFAPKVLAYTPTVRGVVTGLVDAGTGRTSAPPASVASNASVSRGLAALRTPVLHFLSDARQGALPAPTHVAQQEGADANAGAIEPRWGWSTTFLGSLTALLRKEVVGVTPDGLRINWYVRSGSFVGPNLEAVVLPGAADWMRIRRDGVAIVSVQACFETKTGVRVYGSYGGVFDLGPDGFARAEKDEFDELPPVVVTPTYATAAPEMEWMNRAQCVGVGRVDMKALRVEFDVYLVRVGGRIERPGGSD